MAAKLVPLFVYVSPELAGELYEYCEKREKSISSAVRGMIARELKKANTKKKGADESRVS